MKLGGSISFQLIDIFNIMDDSSLSEEEKVQKVGEYQASLVEEGKGLLINKDRKSGENMKNGFYVFGNVDSMSYEALQNVKRYVEESLSSLTCEGEMKMSNIIRGYNPETQDIVYNFALSDKIYDYARSHQKDMRGHTLVWHKHEPKAVLDQYIEDRLGVPLAEYEEKNPETFFEDRKRLTKQFLASYMKRVGEQYPECYCWDVINEIVPELETGRPTAEEREEGLRDSLWREYLGDEFYIDVLEVARENLPEGTKLFYNEFGEQHPEKRAGILRVVDSIKEYEERTGKVILDGIGLQSHYSLSVTPDQIDQIHQEFAETGKEIQITELDLLPGKDKTGAVMDFTMQDFEVLWEKIFECADKYQMDAFTAWGMGDDLSWFSSLGAVSTMIGKDGNVKPFAKDFVERNKAKTNISMESVVRSAVEAKITREDEDKGRHAEQEVLHEFDNDKDIGEDEGAK